MQDAKATQRIESKFRSLIGIMDEGMRRQWAGAEAQAFGSALLGGLMDEVTLRSSAEGTIIRLVKHLGGSATGAA